MTTRIALFLVVLIVLFFVVDALWLSAGSVVGGYVTARVMLRLDPQRLRRLVVVLGLTLCAWFFVRALTV